MRFAIHEQLLADCHVLGRFDSCWLLLHRDAAIPWFILVPETDKSDLLALESNSLVDVLSECRLINQFILQNLGYKKTNFAAIGNLVPQLHVHVIGRHESDPCWPAPVWGNLNSDERYSSDQLETHKKSLVKSCSLQSSNHFL